MKRTAMPLTGHYARTDAIVSVDDDKTTTTMTTFCVAGDAQFCDGPRRVLFASSFDEDDDETTTTMTTTTTTTNDNDDLLEGKQNSRLRTVY